MNGYDGSFLGLGFSRGGVGNEGAAPSNATDSLMTHYLQQCLDFHEEQQQQHEVETSVPQFVTAQHPPAPPPVTVHVSVATSQSEQTIPPTFATTTEQSISSATCSVSDPLSNPATQEAIAKAQAIVQKFQQFPPSSSLNDSSILPSDYRFRRQQQLAKEQERLHKATLKNFAYVAKREEVRLQQQLAQLQATKEMQQQLHQQQAVMLRNRQALSTAGIGTTRRQTLEKQKRRQGNVARVNNDLSVAIYISGLPPTITEDFLREWFESYGVIRRIHLYRNKETGELKGDALLVYNVRKDAEKQDTLDAVCSQMNGAELPCGSVLRVEPADPEYKQRPSGSKEITSVNNDFGHYGPSSGAPMEGEELVTPKVNPSKENGVGGGENETDEDLDDFFDSL